MDFPEVAQSWPKQTNTNYERENHDILSNTLEIFKGFGNQDDDGDTLDFQKGAGDTKKLKKKKGKQGKIKEGERLENGADDYYYDGRKPFI